MGQQLSAEEIVGQCDKELKLSPAQCRIIPRHQNGDKYCPPVSLQVLVHDEWLISFQAGKSLPAKALDFSKDEAELYLQHSCGLTPPALWNIHSLQIIPKIPSNAIKHPASLPQDKPLISTDSMWDFFTHVAYLNQHLSWASFVQNSSDCLKEFKTPLPQLTPKLFAHLVKTLYNLPVVALLSSEKPGATLSSSSAAGSRSEPVEPSPAAGGSGSGDPAPHHANLSPLLAAAESSSAFFLLYPQEKFTLEDLMLRSPAVGEGHESKLQFVLYQLLQCLAHLHQRGVALGAVGLCDVHVDDCLWVHLRSPRCGVAPPPAPPTAAGPGGGREPDADCSSPLKGKPDSCSNVVSEEDNPRWSRHSPSKEGDSDAVEYLWGTVPSLPLGKAFLLWRRGELSNFDYLMILNYAAGRRMEDSNNHPIMPWVTDFSGSHGAWRDFTKTKHLLTKGDRQLDFCYQGAKEDNRLHPEASVVPHHIGDLLTDVTYYMYVARRTSKEVLCSRVRRNWVPKEYPTSISHMYQWTPDECIPEFYCDPVVFSSIHSDLEDLGIPAWTSSPKDFIRHHRALLESDYVSSVLHHWIDLTFGYKLKGESAVKARNIHLALEDKHTNLIPYGVVQLFKSSHPPRLVNSQCTPFALKHPDYDPFLPSFQEQLHGPVSDPSTTSGAGGKEPTPQPGPADPSQKPSTAATSTSTPVNPLEASDGTIGEPAKSKLVFEDVRLEDMPVFSNRNPGLDDSFEDLSTAAGTEGRSVDDNDFGPASFTNIPGVIDQTNQVMEQSTAKNRRLPKTLAGVLRREKNPQTPEEEAFRWKNEQVSSPFEFQPIDPLQRLSELSNFWQKNFKTQPSSGIFADLWTSEELRRFSGLDEQVQSPFAANEEPYFWERQTALSFEEEVKRDIVAVVCVAAEMFFFKHLKTTLLERMSLADRVNHLKSYIRRSHGEVSYFVSSLLEFVFSELCSPRAAASRLGLPGCSVPVLLQQHVTVFAYPRHFAPVYRFLGGLHRLKQEVQRGPGPGRRGEGQAERHSHASCMRTLEYVGRSWPDLIGEVDSQGLEILTLHLTALFRMPRVKVEMVCHVFDKITTFLSPTFVTAQFLHIVQTLYDTSTQPYVYGLLLHRPFLRTVISRFSLKYFLRYFLVYVREAALDPSSARFPYLHQRPQSAEGSGGGMASRLPPQLREDHEASFSYSLASSSSKHMLPSTPPPSPVPEEFGMEEDDEQEDNKEENPYEEFSILLQSDNTKRDSSYSEGASSQGKVSSGEEAIASGLSGLLPYDLLTEETLFPGSQSSSSDGLSFATKLSNTLSSLSPQHHVLVEGGGFDLTTPTLLERPGVHSTPAATATTTDRLSQRHSVSTTRAPGGGGGGTEGGACEGQQRPSQLILELLPEEADSSSVNSVEDRKQPPQPQDGSPRSGAGAGAGAEPQLREEEAVRGSVDPQMRQACTFLSHIALDSLQWLAEWLSPPLVTRHVVQPFLESLPRSFLTCMRGHIERVPAVDFLLFVAQLYGDDVIVKLYLPQVQKWLQPIENQQHTAKSESGLAAAISLLNVCMHAQDSSTLEHNIHIFASEYFLPLVHFTMSTGVVFALGCQARSFVCQAVLQLLLAACSILGREKAFEIQNLQTAVQIFFSRFDEVLSDLGQAPPLASSLAVANLSTPTTTVPEYRKDVVEQLQQVLTPAFLQYAYVQFCHKIGQLKLKDWLYNIDTIEQIVLVEGLDERSFEQSVVVRLHQSLSATEEDEDDEDDEEEEGDGGGGVDLKQLRASCSYGPLQARTENCGGVLGGAASHPSLWFAPLEEDLAKGEEHIAEKMRRADAEFASRYKSSSAEPPSLSYLARTSSNASAVSSEQKLTGSWSKLWESELSNLEGAREQPLVFSNLRLQTYSGHKGPITKLSALPDESSFFSVSRDKTVKLWSLANRDDQTDIVQSSLTYSSHQKAIVGLEYFPVTHQVASSGANLHIWDPNTGYCIQEHTPKSGHTFVSMVSIAMPFPVVVMGTMDGHLQLFDLRMKDYVHFWRLNTDIQSSATLKRLAASDGAWIAGTFTGGTVHCLEPRTGEILKYWRATDSAVFGQEITAMRSTKRGHIVLSTSSGGLLMWSSRGEQLQSRKDSSQVLQMFEVMNEQLIGVSSGNQLLFYNNIETQLVRAPRSIRIQGRTLKGSLVSCAPLRHNHTLLLGSDTGQVVLSV